MAEAQASGRARDLVDDPLRHRRIEHARGARPGRDRRRRRARRGRTRGRGSTPRRGRRRSRSERRRTRCSITARTPGGICARPSRRTPSRRTSSTTNSGLPSVRCVDRLGQGRLRVGRRSRRRCRRRRRRREGRRARPAPRSARARAPRGSRPAVAAGSGRRRACAPRTSDAAVGDLPRDVPQEEQRRLVGGVQVVQHERGAARTRDARRSRAGDRLEQPEAGALRLQGRGLRKVGEPVAQLGEDLRQRRPAVATLGAQRVVVEAARVRAQRLDPGPVGGRPAGLPAAPDEHAARPRRAAASTSSSASRLLPMPGLAGHERDPARGRRSPRPAPPVSCASSRSRPTNAGDVRVGASGTQRRASRPDAGSRRAARAARGRARSPAPRRAPRAPVGRPRGPRPDGRSGTGTSMSCARSRSRNGCAADEPLELADQLGVATERRVGADAVLERATCAAPRAARRRPARTPRRRDRRAPDRATARARRAAAARPSRVASRRPSDTSRSKRATSSSSRSTRSR